MQYVLVALYSTSGFVDRRNRIISVPGQLLFHRQN
jgi:hypothetical protein